MRGTNGRLLGERFVARWRLLAVVGCGVASGALVVAQADVLSGLLAGGTHGQASVWAAVALVGIGLARAGLAWLRQATAAGAAAQIKDSLRRHTLRKIDRLGPGWLSRRKPGELVTLLGKGLDGLDPYLVGYLPQAVNAAVVPLMVVVWLAATDLTAALTVLVTLPLIPVFGVLVGKHTKASTERQWRELGSLGGRFLDMLAGLRTLRALGRARAQAEVVRRIAERNRQATMATLRIAFLSGLVLELVATMSVALVAVPLGLHLLDGGVLFADAMLVLILAPEAYLPLRALGTRFHAAAEGLTVAEQAFSVLDEEEPPRRPHRTAGSPKDGIEFDDVGLRYPGRGEHALRDVSLRVDGGERVVLVGSSGAGKSSLITLLLGLARPTSGRILVGGVDLAEMDLEEWRGRLAWLPQRPHLFAATVADNIRLGRPDAGDAEVARAAEAAGAAEFIDGLPAGYGTPLGERGARLSAGQRQRIALARLFLRDAPLVLMDEPTARLDGASEAAVLEATVRLMSGRTVLAVTHRPALLSTADRVVYVSSGTVAAVRGARMEEVVA